MTRLILDRKPIVAGIERRLFLRQTLSLGALSLLTGCDISDQDDVQSVLKLMSRWNDRAQAFLFRREALAPTYRRKRCRARLPLQRLLSRPPTRRNYPPPIIVWNCRA